MVSAQCLQTTWPHTYGASSFLPFFFFLGGSASSSLFSVEGATRGLREERRMGFVALFSSLLHEGHEGAVDVGVGYVNMTGRRPLRLRLALCHMLWFGKMGVK